jgi:hypothetical protein
MKHQLFLLLCILAFISCQKQFEISDSTQGGTGSGGGTGTTPGTTSGAYQAYTKGSYWKYKDSATGGFTTMTATDKTKTINGRNYTAFLQANATQSDTAYYANENHDYYNYFDVKSNTSGATMLLHYLNDTATVGRSWQYAAGQGNGFAAYIRTTTLEKNISLTVNGKTYNNVIHTNLDLMYDVLGTLDKWASYEYYVAKDVGLIRLRTTISTLGLSVVSTLDLVEYQIK